MRGLGRGGGRRIKASVLQKMRDYFWYFFIKCFRNGQQNGGRVEEGERVLRSVEPFLKSPLASAMTEHSHMAYNITA